MADAIALAVYLPLLAAAVVLVWRRPLRALYAFLVGLAAHNLAMSLLYGAAVRGIGLDAIQAWKEVLLVTAVASVVAQRRLPRPDVVDLLALAFALVALLYAVLPQGWLDGDAGARAILYGLRHAWIPVAAYLLGRAVPVDARELRRLGWTLLGAAAGVAAFGLLDEFLVPVEWWRDSGAVGYFNDELGFDYHGPGRLPDNWAFNAGAEEGVYRRLVSTFVSPLGAAFMFVVALLVAASPGPHWRRRGALFGVAALCAVALLFTLSRSSMLVLAGGLVVVAIVRWRAWPVVAAAAVVGVSSVFVLSYQSLAPETHFFAEDLPFQQEQAKRLGDVPEGDLVDPAEPSIRSHLTSLRDGLQEVVRHPQGYGLGNAGATATRFGEPVKAGESNYTEIGVETGIVGLVLFLAWHAVLLVRLFRRARWSAEVDWRWWAGALAASLAAVLALAIQTDAIGVPWLAYCLWWLAGTVRA
jgi:hypothetical protein